MDLQPVIEKLIDSRREGEYWDFKEIHHENNASLLHDILCLANSVTNCDKYIIYGVSDPSKDCELKGIEHSNRKTQAQIIDFLRAQKFAADNRPEVELTGLSVKGIEIDVLRIFDRHEKPYYLSSDYKDKGTQVCKYHIYTRDLDTNTPRTSSANPQKIERMWRERFGLDLMYSERMDRLLQEPHNWEKDFDNKPEAYHKNQPEYNIKLSTPELLEENYSFFYSNHISFYGSMSFRFLSVELFQMDYIYCDEMRLMIPLPENGSFQVNRQIYEYNYYIQNSRQWNVLIFLTDGRLSFVSRNYEAPFIVFKNQSEKDVFCEYINENPTELEKPLCPEASRFHQNKIGLSQITYESNLDNVEKVWCAFKHWRREYI